MMRLGVLGHGFIDWAGGIDFLDTVVDSLLAAEERVELHLMLPVRGKRLALRQGMRRVKRAIRNAVGLPVPTFRSPESHLIDEFAAAFGGSVAVHRIDIGERALMAAGRRLRLQALLPALRPLAAAAPVPWLGYIADFQHRHLPSYFSASECAARDAAYADMLTRARTVIVNSRAVARDALAFAPNCRARIVALPFGAAPRRDWFDHTTTGPEGPLQVHGIEGPYFLISNQFWQHKDHATAWRAFARIASEHPTARLVCTGETSDYRNPQHFDALQRSAADLGISARLHILGLLAKREQIALMRRAVAVIQPTLYEGGPGGGAVYDAVALGVPAIVSNLEVNSEIAEPGITLFPAGDDLALAEAMRHALRATTPRPDADALIRAGRRRRRACGQVLLEAIHAELASLSP